MNGKSGDLRVLTNKNRGISLREADFKTAAQPDKTRPARVALVDDEADVHHFVRKIFEIHVPQWSVDSYLDGAQAIKRLPEVPPDVVLMDVTMPGLSGIQCAKTLKGILPNLRVVMFSGQIDANLLFSCMMAGCWGLLFKPATSTEIILAVEKTLSGSMTFCPRAEKTMRECFNVMGKRIDGWGLTGREQDVLEGLRRGKSDKEIAQTLKMSPSTVHFHSSNIFAKMKVHTRAEAIRKTIEFEDMSSGLLRL